MLIFEILKNFWPEKNSVWVWIWLLIGYYDFLQHLGQVRSLFSLLSYQAWQWMCQKLPSYDLLLCVIRSFFKTITSKKNLSLVATFFWWLVMAETPMSMQNGHKMVIFFFKNTCHVVPMYLLFIFLRSYGYYNSITICL